MPAKAEKLAEETSAVQDIVPTGDQGGGRKTVQPQVADANPKE
uniref:Uncharacterized protein n=1 Tax=Peronospora matthiolae TaxID=2874970 RepID=A0AAV1V820_9STRA